LKILLQEIEMLPGKQMQCYHKMKWEITNSGINEIVCYFIELMIIYLWINMKNIGNKNN